MTVVVLLSLLAITLALSYAMLRTQFTTVQMDGNRTRMAEARQAALAGLAAGLRKMHESGWTGVNTTYSRDLGSHQRFVVSYATGDPWLTSSDPDYVYYPYRVTLTSVGYAADLLYPDMQSSYQVRAVVQLVPRALAPEPPGWASTEGFTIYQWRPYAGQEFVVEVPCRMEGQVRVQTTLSLCEDYPEDTAARQRLLRDWNQARQAGQPDFRPFNDRVSLPYLLNSLAIRQLLTDPLGVTTQNVPPELTPVWERPGHDSTYQLYTGGEHYAVETLGTRLRDVVLGPDPLSNPVGIFCTQGSLEIGRNVTVRGTLIVNRSGSQPGNVSLEGSSITLEPVDLPALEGTSEPVQLPSVVARNDLVAENNATANLRGIMAVDGQFLVDSSGQIETQLQLQGRLLVRDLVIEGHSQWDRPESWWKKTLEDFEEQLETEDPIPYFHQWLEIAKGLDSIPRLTLQADPTPVLYHWKDRSSPLYVPHPDDEGLRWDLLRWDE